MTGRRVVMSIHPHHAARIYGETKPYEFRRTGAGFVAGDMLLIYETSPVSAVTGEVGVQRVLRAAPEDLVGLERDLVEREHVKRYLDGAALPVALHLAQPRRFATRFSLAEVGLSRAPQSYQFLEA